MDASCITPMPISDLDLPERMFKDYNDIYFFVFENRQDLVRVVHPLQREKEDNCLSVPTRRQIQYRNHSRVSRMSM